MKSPGKKRTPEYICNSCGAVYLKWVGRCLQCDQLNTVVEIHEGGAARASSGRAPVQISQLSLENMALSRSTTHVDYLDRILGEGLPAGTAVLLAGEPGIGKSTLLFQMMSRQTDCVLYVSAEESVAQVAKRFRGLTQDLSENLYVVSESRVSEILSHIDRLKPKVVVIDSIQMMHESEDKAKGGMASLREVTDLLVEKAKRDNFILWIVGHVNKEGDIAGPKVLEHIVDTVLVFSMAEDDQLRILQTQKHRFGASGELVLLEMSSQGLSEKKDSESYWLQSHSGKASGCALTPVLVGSRVLCVEVQALVVDSFFPSPRRSTSGFDVNRLFLLLAILEKRLRLPFSRSDVYLNIVGGLKVSDPAADLAVAAALVSAQTERLISHDSVFCGEIGITGELRCPSAWEQRMRAMSQMGHLKDFVSCTRDQPAAVGKLRYQGFSTVVEALRPLLEG